MFIILSLILGGFMNVSAQNKQVATAICEFQLHIDANLADVLGLDNKTLLGIYTQGKNPESVALMNSTFDKIYQRIQAEKVLYLLPIDALKDKVKYTRMGYPIASVKKAAKAADQEQFVSIIVQVTGTEETVRVTGHNYQIHRDQVVEIENSTLSIYPIINIICQFGDQNGKKTQKITGVFQGNEEVLIDSKTVSFSQIILTSEVSADEIPFDAYLDEAIKDLITKLK